MRHLHRLASESLREWKDSNRRQPLLVTGARQVGKTSLVRNFGISSFQQVHEFNFEISRSLHKIFEKDLEPNYLISELSLASDQAIDIEKDLIFFDEIQACPAALASLKYFSEKLPKTPVIAAGSLLGLHLSSESFPVGKVGRLNIFPLTFSEFLKASASKLIFDSWGAAKVSGKISSTLHDRLWDKFLDYLVVGGMPAVVVDYLLHIDNKTSIREVYKAVRQRQGQLLQDYVADIAKHSGKINARHIEGIWNQIPIQLSRAIDGSTSRFRFKDVLPGLNAYRDLAGPIDWLVKAGLALRVPVCHHAELPLKAFTKENTFKLYVFDTGLLGKMLDLQPKVIRDFEFGTFKGFFVENFVAQEILASKDSTPVFSWSEGEAEVEFLIQGETGPIPIEVKSGKRIRSKSLQSFLTRYSPPASLILSGRIPSEEPSSSPQKNRTKMHSLPIYFASMSHVLDSAEL